MQSELKPCPFCGGTNLKTGGDDKVVGVWCLTCQAAGPNHYGSHEWNDRDTCKVCGGDITRYDFDPQGCVCARPAENLRRFAMVFDGEEGWTMLPAPDGEYVKFEDVARSALVDAPAEPAAWATERDDDLTFTSSEIIRDRWIQAGRKVTPVYTRPPHREGEDSEEVARLRGLLDVALEALDTYSDPTSYLDSDGEPLPADAETHEGVYAKETVSSIRAALAATRSGSAPDASGAPKTWGEWEREQQKPDGDR